MALLALSMRCASDRASSIVSVVPAFLLVGCGVALTVPSLMAAALAGLSLNQVGIGTGVLHAARPVGGALGAALSSSFIASGPGRLVDAMRLSAWFSVAMSMSALTATLIVPLRAGRKS